MSLKNNKLNISQELKAYFIGQRERETILLYKDTTFSYSNMNLGTIILIAVGNVI